MKNKIFLGKEVSVFVDGGWSFSGKVISDKKEYILLVDKEEEVSLIYKTKISCITMTKFAISEPEEEKKVSEKKESKSESNFVVFKSGVPRKKEEEKRVDAEPDDLSEGCISLPQEVLLSGHDVSGRRFPKKEVPYEDFSVTLSSLKNANTLSSRNSDDRK